MHTDIKKRGPKPGLPQRGGWKRKPYEERMIQVQISVLGKYFTQAEKELKEIAKKWRA